MKENLLGDAVTELMGSSVTPPSPWVLSALRLLAPVFAAFPSIISYAPVDRIKTIRSRFQTIDSECRVILEHKKREVAEAGSDVGGAKDLITLLRESKFHAKGMCLFHCRSQGKLCGCEERNV